jgi:hypothetical protein
MILFRMSKQNLTYRIIKLLSDKFIEEKKDLQNALNWVLGKF